MIYETIITTMDTAGTPHVAPFGLRHEGDLIVLAPYKPSTTLENIVNTQQAVMNVTDDVRVFAGALAAKPHPALVPATRISGSRLATCLSHQELELVRVEEDTLRPKLFMRSVYQASHAPFNGFNRAQAAVIELAVLVSRLHMLSREKIELEMQYLQIAIDKTAGERELEAWRWLVEKIEVFHAGSQK